MASTMGTSHYLSGNILLTAKNKYEKSSTKTQIVTQQKIQKIIVNLNLPKAMEQSIRVRDQQRDQQEINKILENTHCQIYHQFLRNLFLRQ